MVSLVHSFLLGTILFSFLLHYDCRKLEGYNFTVFSTKVCPKNQKEWNERESAINCTKNNSYMCLPNHELNVLLEFCYTTSIFWMEEGKCFYLSKGASRVDAYDCKTFVSGCPVSSYVSTDLFKHPSCTSIRNGCYLAEPSCDSIPTTTTINTTQRISFENASINENNDFKVLLLSITSICIGIPGVVFYVIRLRRMKCKRKSDEERPEEIELTKETLLEEDIFKRWQQKDKSFVSTKACKKVEQQIESQNLVIVTGNSGSGKSAIIKHIGLKYRESGWVVKKITNINTEMNDLIKNIESETLIIIDNAFGKTSFDEESYLSWKRHKKWLQKRAKILLSCRKYILCEKGKDILKEKFIVDIDNDQCNLTSSEKHQIWNNLTSCTNLPSEEFAEIAKVHMYFPLLCKKMFEKDEHLESVQLFKFLFRQVCREEIKNFRDCQKAIYCPLVLLVLFKNNLNVKNILEDKFSENIFRCALKLCGLENDTLPHDIKKKLDLLNGLYVKKIGNSYQFFNDIIMETTAFVFGKSYPLDLIRNADISFIRKKVKIDFKEKKDRDTLYIDDIHKDIDTLGERLFTEIFGERLFDVVLNSYLKNEKVIKVFKKKLTLQPEKLQMLLNKKEIKIDIQEHYLIPECFLLSYLDILDVENEISPLCALILFGCNDLSLYCLQNLHQLQINFKCKSLFSALFCNGSMELLNIFLKDSEPLFLTESYSSYHPIHIVSLFHNFEMLTELVKLGIDVNLKTKDGLTPLMLAAGRMIRENKPFYQGIMSEERRNATVQLLLESGAEKNICVNNGLRHHCKYGSNVQFELIQRSRINSLFTDGTSRLYVASASGNDSMVKLLLSNGADINLCTREGGSPLYIACQNGHNSTVQLLLRKGADINLCMKNGASPLYIASQTEHESTVQLLLNEGADYNLCMKDGASPLHIACFSGFYSIVDMLLKKGAQTNKCMEIYGDKWGCTPLHCAYCCGSDDIVELLHRYSADINLSSENEPRPDEITEHFNRKSTVKLLLAFSAAT